MNGDHGPPTTDGAMTAADVAARIVAMAADQAADDGEPMVMDERWGKAPMVNDIQLIRVPRNLTAKARYKLMRSIERTIFGPHETCVVMAIGHASAEAISQAAVSLSEMTVGQTECRYCGCTHEVACEGGCEWVGPEVCSNPECMEEARKEGLI